MNHKRKAAATKPADHAPEGIVEALEHGDNRRARRLSHEALSRADSPSAERQTAEDALRRTDVDRPTIAAALAAFALIFFLAVVLIAPNP